MARSNRTSYSVRADILSRFDGPRANYLGFRSVAVWLTSLAENGVHDFDETIWLSPGERRPRPHPRARLRTADPAGAGYTGALKYH